jgi:hypothetical protein
MTFTRQTAIIGFAVAAAIILLGSIFFVVRRPHRPTASNSTSSTTLAHTPAMVFGAIKESAGVTFTRISQLGKKSEQYQWRHYLTVVH